MLKKKKGDSREGMERPWAHGHPTPNALDGPTEVYRMCMHGLGYFVLSYFPVLDNYFAGKKLHGEELRCKKASKERLPHERKKGVFSYDDLKLNQAEVLL